MAVLVTGSAGHLGEALMRTLRARGHQAYGIDRKPSAFTDIVGSITDRGFVRQAVVGVRSIIHAATLHKPHVETHGNREFLDVNITGTLNLLEEAAATGVERFIFTSTTSAFGENSVGRCFPELTGSMSMRWRGRNSDGGRSAIFNMCWTAWMQARTGAAPSWRPSAPRATIKWASANNPKDSGCICENQQSIDLNPVGSRRAFPKWSEQSRAAEAE
jgi:NAD(P)-dependent dehydrogenase (short-subunit alcohol dehydrogenase family)